MRLLFCEVSCAVSAISLVQYQYHRSHYQYSRISTLCMHSVQAHTMAHSVFWTLDREQYSSMEVTEPSLCLLIQHSLLKSLAIASTCAMYAQHPSTAYGNNVSIGGTSSIVR